MNPAVRARDVAVSLGGTPVLRGVDLTVGEGRFVGLVGPNGAGKTTLLRTLNGALTPDRGRVDVAGERMHDLPSKAASRLVATVPQDTSLSFDFDVRATVEMGRTPHLSRFGGMAESDRRAVEEAMARTDVAPFADRAVTDVSGGERQRVLLARALAQETPVLLLDEPTGSLDINHQIRTLELVAGLVEEGRTVVAAIHDLNLAARYCDELALLAGGRILAAGDPGAVLTEARVREAFDAESVVARHPVTGTASVTALSDRAADAGRVHVVGGGGAATPHLYALDRRGYAVSVGALNEGDSDAATARELGLDRVTVPPFAPVDADAERAVRERVRDADVTVVADVEVGEGNLPNLRAALDADRLVVVEERPFEARNHAGEAGRRAYASLVGEAAVVERSEVVDAVEEAVEEAAATRSLADD